MTEEATDTTDPADTKESTEGTAPPNESKSDKFKRLGSKRVATALDKIRLIENLSGSGYEYTEEQAQKIAGALEATVASVKAALLKRFEKKAAEPGGFQL